MGFSRQEYWSRLPRPSPGNYPHPEIKFASLESPALAGRFFTISTAWEIREWLLRGNKYITSFQKDWWTQIPDPVSEAVWSSK